MFYSSKAPELRAFFRDKFGFPTTDVGGGWLIFDFAEADLGCHETDGRSGPPSGTNHVSFYCDDIHKTIAELKGRGVEFTEGVKDQGWGLVTHFKAPGDFEIQLYQPKYTKSAR